MKVDFRNPINDLEGKVLEHEGKPLTLGRVAVNSLLGVFPDEPQVFDPKVTRFKLAMRIHESGDAQVDVTAEEIVELKKVIGKVYGPIVVGRVNQLIEG